MTDTQTKTRTITLTDRPPVRITEENWPIVAHGNYRDHDGQVYAQANRIWHIDIRVRQHADGRAIVYGTYDYDTHFQREAGETHRVGSLLDAGANLPAAIQAVRDELIDRVSDEDMHRHIRDAANECIADLPAETLE